MARIVEITAHAIGLAPLLDGRGPEALWDGPAGGQGGVAGVGDVEGGVDGAVGLEDGDVGLEVGGVEDLAGAGAIGMAVVLGGTRG